MVQKSGCTCALHSSRLSPLSTTMHGGKSHPSCVFRDACTPRWSTVGRLHALTSANVFIPSESAQARGDTALQGTGYCQRPPRCWLAANGEPVLAGGHRLKQTHTGWIHGWIHAGTITANLVSECAHGNQWRRGTGGRSAFQSAGVCRSEEWNKGAGQQPGRARRRCCESE